MTSVLARPSDSGTDAVPPETSILRLARTSRVVQAALVLIAVQLGYRAWVTFGAWYHYDDYAFISRMLNQGLSPEVAARQYAGHIMPAAMYLSWLFNEIAPLQWWPTATFLFLMQAVAAVGLLRLLLRWFGPRPGILPPLVLYLFTVFTVPVAIWWAAGANQLPIQIALFFGLTSHVEHLRTRRLRHALAAAAWVVAGLLFCEKTILVLGAYAIVTFCYFARGGAGQRLLQVVRENRAALVLYGSLGIVYLALYVRFGLTFSPGRATDSPIAPVAGNIVLRNWLTGLFGGPLHWWYVDDPGAVATASDIVVAVSAVLFLLLLRELRRTRPGSLRALYLPGFFLLSNVLLVLAGRASYVGALIALDYRYQGESGAVAAIALACATMPIVGSVQGVHHAVRSELFDVPQRVAVACGLVAVLGLISSTQYVVHWHASDTSRTYTAAVLHDLRASRASVNLIDGVVPKQLLWAAAYPLDSHSYLLRQFPQARFVTISTDRLSMVGPDGHLRPAVIPPVRSAVPVPGKRCAYKIADRDRTIPLTGPLAFGGWWVRIGYIASARSPVSVSAGGATYRTTVDAGLHSLYLKAGAADFDSVTISALSGSATLCTDDVTVGRPEPATVETP